MTQDISGCFGRTKQEAGRLAADRGMFRQVVVKATCYPEYARLDGFYVTFSLNGFFNLFFKISWMLVYHHYTMFRIAVAVQPTKYNGRA
jgi:hypothetical protein